MRNIKGNIYRQQGAVLLTVLVVSVALILLLSLSAYLIEQKTQFALEATESVMATAHVDKKAAELAYLLATERITPAGVVTGIATDGDARDEDGLFLNLVTGDEVRLDGYIYKEEKLSFSIQNESGLLPMLAAGSFWTRQWLQASGVPNLTQSKLVDTLADYVDADNWRRPAGAESGYYNANSLNGPANYLPQTCNEVFNLPSWKELANSLPEMMRYCSLRRSAEMNINAIPVSLWENLWPASAERVATMREQHQFLLTANDMLLLEPGLTRFSDEYLVPMGGKYFIVTINSGPSSKKTRLVRGEGNNPPLQFISLY